ncbi:MAG: M48 family metalloprotease [Myxococcaceae bacterium]|jgi:Zn-dependent protease with chaperone function|nr:M48 family metalloprotease [Myxococcaceae bacterium]MCA3011763.1 M48 family metalloprotease [Myxococcaceae bacterium]
MAAPEHDLAAVFPPSPDTVPEGFTAPSKAYRRHAWLALWGLLAFVALYLGLTGFLAHAVWRQLGTALLHGGDVFVASLMSIPPLVLLAFLVRGLFVVRHTADPTLVEVDPARQPTLFAFIGKLADDTGAPRPNKVFLSGRVNAAVFYELSFWNLLFPTKKNLELGLGLVNALTLDELKAVVAHEYGHFAQRTMAVGRWVYVAQQIAGHVVTSRGPLDRLLEGLSRIDVRLGWVGWLGRLFVWAMRAVLDTAFRLVVLAHRALSREMEFNADLVAVSVSGSDSLVHALHRLGPADEAWDEAASFAAEELSAGRSVDDLFALQTAALEHLRRILAQPDLGRTPRRPDDGATFRVFDAKLAQPPKMWLTHPSNREREDGAKATYVPSALDARPAWALFADAESVRREVTAKLFEQARQRHLQGPSTVASPPPEGSALDRFASRFLRTALDPRYRGAYLGRSIVALQKDASGLFGPVPALGPEALEGALSGLYPARLEGLLVSYRERREEEALLEGLNDGVLTAPGGVIRYRGQELRRQELPRVLDSVRAERRDLEARVLEHDRACRATHLAAARRLGHGWDAHLEGLVRLLHFAGHSLRNLSDAHGHLHHVLAIALLDGRVSEAEQRRLRASADDLHLVLETTWANVHALALPDDVSAAVEAGGGLSAFTGDMALARPTDGQLADWLKAVDGWVQGALGDLTLLADATLDGLLEVEHDVARWAIAGADVPTAPAPAVVPARYGTCVVGAERERQKSLEWWDRFQTADGLVPGALRVVVALGLLLPALFVGGSVGRATVHVVNGLATPVVVTFDGTRHVVPAHGLDRWEAEPSGRTRVETTTPSGVPIEAFDVELGGGLSHALYDVAQAVPLVEWTAVYAGGTGTEGAHRPLGAPRWMNAPQDHVLERPPTSVTLKRGQTKRLEVVTALLDASPATQLQAVADAEARTALLSGHVRFDETSSEHFAEWSSLSSDDLAVTPLLLERAAANPRDVMLQRLAMEVDAAARAAVCERVDPRSGDVDALYLSLRCRDASADDLVAAWEQHREHPWLNWAVASTLAAAGRWRDGAEALEKALASKALGPMRDTGQLEYLRLVRSAAAAGVPLKEQPAVLAVRQGTSLAFVRRIEGPARSDDWPVPVAWRALGQGRLTEALRAGGAAGAEGLAERMRVLVALSDGATPADLEAALGAPAGGVEAWLRVALQLRAGRRVDSPGEFLPGVRSTEAQGAVLSALQDPGLAKRPRRLDAVMVGLDVRQRAIVAALGVVALGERAPAAWRETAKAGLFAFERPSFR